MLDSGWAGIMAILAFLAIWEPSALRKEYGKAEEEKNDEI